MSAKTIYFLFFFVPSLTQLFGQNNPSLAPADFLKNFRAQNQAALIDLRDAKSFERAHLKNAINIEYEDDNFESNFKAAIPKDRPIFLYCYAGNNSQEAVVFLKDLGYKVVADLKGGFSAWTAASQPYVSGLGNTQPIAAFTLNNLYTAVKSNEQLLVMLHAPTCDYCKKMEAIIRSMTTNRNIKLLKIDITENKNIADFYESHKTPTFILYKRSRQVWKAVGDLSEKELADVFKKAGM